MEALGLIERARILGLRLTAESGQLVVEGTATSEAEDLVEMLRPRKGEVMAVLSRPESVGLAQERLQAARSPLVRFRMRETEDIVADVTWLRRIRQVIAEYQPGENEVIMTVVTLDGRRVRAMWSAHAVRGLRLGIARLLAKRASREAVRCSPRPGEATHDAS